jgi:hypothetical protein
MVDPWKVLMWTLLGISSLSLHLLSVILHSPLFQRLLNLMSNHSYNSVIYASIGVNDYFVFLVNQNLVENYDNTEYLLDDSFEFSNGQGSIPSYMSTSSDSVLSQLLESARAGELDRLDNEDCIKSYGKMYLSNRSNLLLIGSAFPVIEYDMPVIPAIFVPNEIIDKPRPLNCAVDPVPWICVENCGAECVDSWCDVACVNRLNEVEPQNWNVPAVEGLPESEKPGEAIATNFAVDYCLSQPTEESCKLQFSLPIAIVIISFNFSKAVIMLILVFGLREARVQTIGDAVASFLIQPDHMVSGRCLYSAPYFKHVGLSGNPRKLIFTNKSIRFAETGEKRVWLLTYIL